MFISEGGKTEKWFVTHDKISELLYTLNLEMKITEGEIK